MLTDLHRNSNLHKIKEAFERCTEKRDFGGMMFFARQLYLSGSDEDFVWRSLFLLWENMSISNSVISKGCKEFRKAKESQKASRCIEFILYEVKCGRIASTFDYIQQIIELPPYCDSLHLRGYFGMLAAFMKDDKLAIKNLLASKHCDPVFDGLCGELLLKSNNKITKAIAFLKESHGFFPENSLILSLLYPLEPHNYAFLFWKIIYAQRINLPIDPTAFLSSLENQFPSHYEEEALIWAIAQIEANFLDEKAWLILKALLPTNLRLLNLQFILPEWNEKLENPSSIPPSTLELIRCCLKMIFPPQ